MKRGGDEEWETKRGEDERWGEAKRGDVEKGR